MGQRITATVARGPFESTTDGWPRSLTCFGVQWSRNGETRFDAVSEALSWLDVVAVDEVGARRAAELLASLHDAGSALAARDAFVAGIAHAREERLVATDSDFENAALTNHVPIDVPGKTD